MRDDLTAFLQEQPDLVLGMLFGSVNRGTERWGSDLDVGVMADEQKCMEV